MLHSELGPECSGCSHMTADRLWWLGLQELVISAICSVQSQVQVVAEPVIIKQGSLVQLLLLLCFCTIVDHIICTHTHTYAFFRYSKRWQKSKGQGSCKECKPVKMSNRYVFVKIANRIKLYMKKLH